MDADTFFAPNLLSAEEMAHLPMFPLPNTVLFPHTFLPLHIFEPRYRVMVSTVMKEGGAMGVVMLRPGYESEAEGKPPVMPVAGAGRIVHHNELADGRHMILLRGLHRVTLHHELHSDEPFRRFSVADIVGDELSGTSAASAIATMQNCAQQIALAMTEGGPELLKAVSLTKRAGELADLLASALIGEPELQQSLLEMNYAQARVDKVVATMAELLLSLPNNKTSGPTGLEN